MNKLIQCIASVAVLLASTSLFATGLSFQTLAPTTGDLLASGGGFLPDNTVVSYGTLAGNLNAAGTATFTEYTEYSDIFTPITTSLIAAGETSGSIASGSLGAGVNLWLVIDTGAEQGAFYLGATPGLGVLISNPAAGSAGFGDDTGANLTTAAVVPEPSAFGLIAGLFGFAWVMVRRRA